MKISIVRMDGKGYYRAEYKNFVVYHQDRREARKELRRLIDRYHGGSLIYKVARIVVKFMKRWM